MSLVAPGWYFVRGHVGAAVETLSDACPLKFKPDEQLVIAWAPPVPLKDTCFLLSFVVTKTSFADAIEPVPLK